MIEKRKKEKKKQKNATWKLKYDLINEKLTETILLVQHSIIHFFNAPAMVFFPLQNPLFPVIHTQTNRLNILANLQFIIKETPTSCCAWKLNFTWKTTQQTCPRSTQK